MNKELSAFLNANNFRESGKNCFYGSYKGFQFNGIAFGNYPSVSVEVYLDETNVNVVNGWFKQNSKSYSVSNYNVSANGITANFGGFTLSFQSKMAAFMNDIAEYLATITAPDSCPFCGEPLEGNFEKGEPVYIDCNGNRFRIHDNCYNDYVEKATQADAQAAAAPGNYLRGALGMLLGSLVGGGIFIGLYFLGFIAWIAPLAAAFLGSFLYTKFGGKNDKIKIIILWAITVVIMAISLFAAFAIDIYTSFAEEGLEVENFFELFSWGMTEVEAFRNAVLQDVIISAIFLVGSDAYMTYYVIKSQKPTSTYIKKLGN